MDGTTKMVAAPLTGAMYPHEATRELQTLQKEARFAGAPDFVRMMFYRALQAEVTKAYVLGYHRGELAGVLSVETEQISG